MIASMAVQPDVSRRHEFSLSKRMRCPTYNQQFTFRYPNWWDRCLLAETEMWRQIQAAGGIRSLVSPFRERLLRTGNWGEPWMRMPAEAIPVNQISSIPLPVAGTGTDLLVLSVTVPNGYDGVISSRLHMYTGTGFVEASGDLTWRLKVNMRYPKGMGTMTTSLGSLTTPGPITPGGLRVYSDEILRYYVNMAVGAEARINGGNIICGLTGWYYPQE
jgi:hypothetical protein